MNRLLELCGTSGRSPHECLALVREAKGDGHSVASHFPEQGNGVDLPRILSRDVSSLAESRQWKRAA